MSLKLDKLLAMKEEYKKNVKAEGELILKELFSSFFLENPEVKSLKFQAYTPHFNDGDPCVFHVGDIYARIENVDFLRANLKDHSLSETLYKQTTTKNKWGSYESEKVGERSYSDEELLNGGDREDGYYYNWDFKENTKLQKALNVLSKHLSDAEDIVLMTLGDHIEVTVTRDSFEVEEYEHD